MELIKTRQQIADEFGTSTKTLKNWLTKHNIHLPQCSLTPRYQKVIYDALGYPPNVNKSVYENV